MTQPPHTPAQAVQYWYDAATERREERDRLRAVVARIRQMADHWEQQLPEVIRTPAVVSALRAALESAPAVAALTTNQLAAHTDWVDGHPQLEAIAAAVWEQCGRSDSGACVEDDPRNIAVAALAAMLPEPTSQACVLLAAADKLAAEVQAAMRTTPDDARLPGLLAAVEGLRRLAAEDDGAEAQQQPAPAREA